MVVVVFVGYGIKFDLVIELDGKEMWMLKFYFCLWDVLLWVGELLDENFIMVNVVGLKYYLVLLDEIY